MIVINTLVIHPGMGFELLVSEWSALNCQSSVGTDDTYVAA